MKSGSKRCKLIVLLWLLALVSAFGENEISSASNKSTENNRQYAVQQLFCIDEWSGVLDNTHLKLCFTNPLTQVSALNLQNFSCDNGLKFYSAHFDTMKNGQLDYKTIILETSPQVSNRQYKVKFQEGLKDVYGQSVYRTERFRSYYFLGGSSDVIPLRLVSVIPLNYNTIELKFDEMFGLSIKNAMKLETYQIYEADTKKTVKLTSVQVNNTDPRVILSVDTLKKGIPYVVLVEGLGTLKTEKELIKGSFMISERDDSAADLIGVEVIALNQMRLTFNKAVLLPENFNISNVVTNAYVEPLSLRHDAYAPNVLWLETTDHNKAGDFSLAIGGIFDLFGHSTSITQTSKHYKVDLACSDTFVMGQVNNEVRYNKNLVEITFNKPIERQGIDDISHYYVNALRVLGVYQRSENKIILVTEEQKKDYQYRLHIEQLRSNSGAVLNSKSSTQIFIGQTLD